jgi:hypothetical protein
MATSATIKQIRSVVLVGTETKFRLNSEITAASGFRDSTLMLFVFNDSDEYQHVARVGDVEQLDEGPNADPYYRKSVMQVDYDTVEEAQAESDAQKQGLQDLVTDYEAYKSEYEDPDDENTYTAP